VIVIKTKASKRKKPDGTGWKCKASITYKQFTQEELETLTPTEKKYITKAALAYHEWESLDGHIKSEQKRLIALEREQIKTLQAYSRYLRKVNSPVMGFISEWMCVIQYRDYMQAHTDEMPF
jgi:hypothetical protein